MTTIIANRTNNANAYDLAEHYSRMKSRAPHYYEDSTRYIIIGMYFNPCDVHDIYNSFEDAADALGERMWREWCAMDSDSREDYDNDYDTFVKCEFYFFSFMPLHEWRAYARRAKYGNDSVVSYIDHVVNAAARGEL